MEQTNQPNPGVSLHPQEEVKETVLSSVLSNKVLIFGAIFVVAAVVISLSSLFESNSSKHYQGMIQKVEQETQLLQRSADPTT